MGLRCGFVLLLTDRLRGSGIPDIPRRIKRLLGNLLDNAVRHGGGPVAVRLGATPAARWPEVDDEDPGIGSQDRESIFERFVRGRVASRWA